MKKRENLFIQTQKKAGSHSIKEKQVVINAHIANFENIRLSDQSAKI